MPRSDRSAEKDGQERVEPTFGDELRKLGIGRKFVYIARSAEVARPPDSYTEEEIHETILRIRESGLLERAGEIARRVSRESNLL